MAKHPDATTLVDAESTKLAAANGAAALALELEREGFAGIYVGARGAPPNRVPLRADALRTRSRFRRGPFVSARRPVHARPGERVEPART